MLLAVSCFRVESKLLTIARLQANTLLHGTVVTRRLLHDLPRCALRQGLVAVVPALGTLALRLLLLRLLAAALELDLEGLDVGGAEGNGSGVGANHIVP